MMRRGISGLSVALIVWASGAAAQSAHDELVVKHATAHNVPESLVRRIIRIESGGNPGLVNGDNYGLMQIKLGTARAMGYPGSPDGLLDADTNMTYAVKYLAGAYRAAGCDAERAVSYYQRGYYGAAQFKCGATMQLAGAQTQTTPAEKPAAIAAQDVASPQAGAKLQQDDVSGSSSPSGDVIKPKVVHTVSVPRRSLEGAPNASGPLFVEDAAAPAKPDTFAERLVLVPAERSVTTGARASVESVSALPTPAKKLDLQSASKQDAQPKHPSPKKRAVAAKHTATANHKHANEKNESSSSGDLISFLKNLVTPEKKPPARKQGKQARAESPR